jgi:predicted TPR repeat methyltransferase
MRRGTLSAPQERPMPYRIAGIDVHKKMLAKRDEQADAQTGYDDACQATAAHMNANARRQPRCRYFPDRFVRVLT